MIIRSGDQWTTIQCPQCKDCHKVLNDKHMRVVSCPYCGHTIELSKGTVPLIKPRSKAATVEDAGTLLWKES